MFLRLSILMFAAVALQAAEAVRVGLLVEVPAGMPAGLVEEFERQTVAILTPSGAEFVWRGTREGAGEMFERVVVMRFAGACTLRSDVAVGRREALGITHVSDGRVLPFVELDCGRILGAVRAERNEPFLSTFQAARALARVAAHEIHHVLTASGTHDREGITKASFSPADLGSWQMALSPVAVRRLQHALHMDGLQSEARGHQRAQTEE